MEVNKKVLIVEDEAPIRRVLEFKLKNSGYRVLIAKNGAQGLELIKTQQPDAVITDIMMPEMDGRQLCEQSNVLKKKRSFLTIVVTCRIAQDEQQWINQMQDTVFMEKPFSPARLVECIDQYLGIKR
ncbi:MAG: response regulator [Desulfobacterales bacterium]